MPIYNYKCYDCGYINKLFHNEKIVCEKCESEKLLKILSVPLKIQNTEKNGGNRSVIPELTDEVKKRNKWHKEQTLEDTIDKFGETIAKEQGWIDKKGKKKYKKKKNI